LLDSFFFLLTVWKANSLALSHLSPFFLLFDSPFSFLLSFSLSTLRQKRLALPTPPISSSSFHPPSFSSEWAVIPRGVQVHSVVDLGAHFFDALGGQVSLFTLKREEEREGRREGGGGSGWCCPS